VREFLQLHFSNLNLLYDIMDLLCCLVMAAPHRHSAIDACISST